VIVLPILRMDRQQESVDGADDLRRGRAEQAGRLAEPVDLVGGDIPLIGEIAGAATARKSCSFAVSLSDMGQEGAQGKAGR